MDNRIRFDSTRIDFEGDVGLTGQEHDNYPAPNSQARYDHLRSFLIGLLSNQSSDTEPTQYRNGSLWFDSALGVLKVRSGDEWAVLSSVAQITDSLTIKQWYDASKTIIEGASPEVVFNCEITADGVTSITVPESLRGYVYSDTRAFIYVNGLLLDPRYSTILGAPPPPRIQIVSGSLSAGDRIIVILKRIPDTHYYTDTVRIP